MDLIGIIKYLDDPRREQGRIHSLESIMYISIAAVIGSARTENPDGCFDRLHIVSAWATANGISLGQERVKDKSNEITAIPVYEAKIFSIREEKYFSLRIENILFARRKYSTCKEKNRNNYIMSEIDL